jgi:membrane AbrB-like protein
MFGPMFACLAAALSGVQLATIKPISDAMRTILGVAAGATVTVEFLTSLPTMWATLMLVPVMTLLIGLLGVWYFSWFAGYDFPTAYYASMPGGLQDMIAFGEEAGGSVRAISLIHATRVLVIVVLLPIILTWIWGADLNRPPGETITTFTIDQLVILAACGIIGWQVAKAIGMFGSSILGPLILGAIASVTGILQLDLPPKRSGRHSTSLPSALAQNIRT